MYNYIAAENPIAAARLLGQINKKFESIATLGLTGSPRDEFKIGLRAVPYKNRCIYFTVEDSHLRILRVLHGHEDISPEDFTESSI